MIIGKVLAQRALITPDREALIFNNRTFTFQELNQRSNKTANALLDLGVKQGDRIGLLMFNCNEFLETYFATSKIGAVLVPLNIRLAAPELDFILNDCGVSEFFFGSSFEEKVGEMQYPEKALAPVPLRATRAEAFLKGKKSTLENAGQAASLAFEGSKSLSMNAYKIQIAKKLMIRSIMSASQPE